MRCNTVEVIFLLTGMNYIFGEASDELFEQFTASIKANISYSQLPYLISAFLSLSGPEIIKLLSCSVEHAIHLLVNVKMPTIVGILTFSSRKNK